MDTLNTIFTIIGLLVVLIVVVAVALGGSITFKNKITGKTRTWGKKDADHE